MQTAGTLRGTRAISLLALLVPLIGYVYSSPLQYLPSIPGYVPVYIRYGDEPLEEINPDLAEAFGETSNSIKNLQKLDTLVRESDNFKDDDIDAFLEESKSKHSYPLHVRATESRSFVTSDDEPGSRNPNRPKLLTIYELPDDNENRSHRRHRERARMRSSKPPAFKVSPLSDAEKEELRKLAIEVEKEETKPNELYVPSSKYHEIPRIASMHNRHNAHHFGAPVKVQNPFDESSASANLPETPQVTDFSKSSDEHDVAAPEAEDENEPPVKEQRPATVLSNVDKLSPIEPPDENKTSEDIASEAATQKASVAEATSSEISQIIDLLEASHNHDVAAGTEKKEPPVKVQRPATILSNVDKLSPIDLPDDSDTNENDKRRDSAEPNDEIAMD